MEEFFAYRVGYKKDLNSMITHGYSRQFAASNDGSAYGDGVYCNLTLKQAYAGLKWGKYGDTIIKNKIKGGIQGCLILNEHYAKQVYGNSDLKYQVYQLFPAEIAHKVWHDFDEIIKKYHLSWNDLMGPYRTTQLIRVIFSNMRKEYETLFQRYNVRGIIYTGGGDGLSIVVYNFSEVIPVAYLGPGDKDFKPINFQDYKVDARRLYGLKYKKVYDSIYFKSDEGIIPYSVVQKNNGKWNMIDAKAGKEISPVDFDSITSLNPETGLFDIEYDGKFYIACVQGYFPSQEALEAGEGYTFDELLKGNINESEYFEKILEEAILNAATSLFKKKKNIVKEDIDTILNKNTDDSIDESLYWQYEMPDEQEIDNPSYTSVYKVIESKNIDSITNFSEDDEFLGANGLVYGRGVYSWVNLSDAKKLQKGGYYGNSVIQYKLIGGFDRFIIFSEEMAKKIYGKNYQILDQLKTFLSESQAMEVYSACRNDNPSAVARFSSKYKIRGVIYYWSHGLVSLIYDISSVIPYAVSINGAPFKKIFNANTKDRIQYTVDVKWRYGGKYKRIDKAIKGESKNGGITGYSRIQKNNGKWNMIDAQTGEEISPVDFDSITSLNPETGLFDIEYNGKFYIACVQGYFPSQEALETGEGYTFDELLK